MRANVVVDSKNIGFVGVLHPEVITNFSLGFAVSVCEICIESFV